jgi:DNA polymerase-4
MDAFYASVEMRDDPSLAGLPVAVGGPAQARGVITSASYAARARGVRSAMSTAAALRACPELVLVPGRMETYAAVSRTLRRVLGEFTPCLEPLSLDEAYLDLTGTERLLGPPGSIGERIRTRIREELSLPASVGVASSKLVAKLASDAAKPDGLLVVAPAQAEAFVRGLPLARLPGVGPRTESALARLGIRTTEALAQADPRHLARRLGAGAARLCELARGVDDRPVVSGGRPKSLSRETTFARDVSDAGVLAAVALGLAEEVARRARARGVAGRTVVLKLRTADFRTRTRRRTLPVPAADAAPLHAACARLMEGALRPGTRVRLLGVALSGLVDAFALDLFAGPPDEATRERLQRAEDDVVLRFGRRSLSRARTLLSDPGTRARRAARGARRR